VLSEFNDVLRVYVEHSVANSRLSVRAEDTAELLTVEVRHIEERSEQFAPIRPLTCVLCARNESVKPLIERKGDTE